MAVSERTGETLKNPITPHRDREFQCYSLQHLYNETICFPIKDASSIPQSSVIGMGSQTIRSHYMHE